MKIVKIMGCVFMALLLMNCSNFDDINTNPDSTTEGSASMLCTNNILVMAKFSGKDAKAMVSDNAFPKYVGYANEGIMGTQYNQIGNSSFGAMTMLPNIDQMNEYAKGTLMESSYAGVGYFLRAAMFYRLTMEMGDVPYSEANLGLKEVYRPKYDLQEDVLLGVVNELEKADSCFKSGTTFNGDPTPYNGNPDKWRRATNAFALRVLMSLSSKEGSSKIKIKERFEKIVAENYLMEASTGYWGLVYSSQNRHPLYSTSDQFTSRTVISSLLIDHLKKLSDRRMYYIAEPSKAQIASGISESDPDAYVGVDVSMDYAQMNAMHSANKFSALNLRYQLEEASEPRMLITYAEQQLILAEARVRNWITTGLAEDYYQSGVKAALSSMMANTQTKYTHGMAINQDYINSYFTNEATFKISTSDQLKQIWMQRYILNFFQDPETSYFEYRRTGYPDFPINPDTNLNEDNKNGIPLRWLYPTGESDYNRDNLVEALDRQFDGYDEVNKVMWILK